MDDALKTELRLLREAVERLDAFVRAPTSRAIEPTAIYSVGSAAALVELHPQTLRKFLRMGLIKGSRRLGDWRIKGAELLRMA